MAELDALESKRKPNKNFQKNNFSQDNGRPYNSSDMSELMGKSNIEILFDILSNDDNIRNAYFSAMESDEDIEPFVGKVILKLRLFNNLTQEELCKISDVSQTYLSLIESGLRSPRRPILNSIAKGLKVSPHLILSLAALLSRQGENDFIDKLINKIFGDD